MFGSASRCRNDCSGFIGSALDAARRRSRGRRSSPPTLTVSPSAWARRSSIESALMSMAPAASASSTV